MASLDPLLLIASFRGVLFRVKNANTVFGRRNQIHEYPLRDTPYSEDLGKKAREYTINAYVIGTAYRVFRTLIINAIERNNTPGQLIHPVLGIKTVVPTECTHMYDNEQGGVEYFQLTFVEAGANLFPDVLSDLVGLFGISRTTGLNSLISRFGTAFSVASSVGFVKDAASSVLSNASATSLDATSVGVVDSELYSEYVYDNNVFNSTLVRSTDSDAIANGLSGLITGLTIIYPSAVDAYAAQKSLLLFASSLLPVIPTTPNRAHQLANQNAIINIFIGTVLIEMANAITSMTFNDIDSALALKDEISGLFDNQLSVLSNQGESEQYVALADVKAAIVQDLTERSIALPSLVEIPINDSIPACVFAYNEYDNSALDSQVVENNNIRNPLFLPPFSNIRTFQ